MMSETLQPTLFPQTELPLMSSQEGSRAKISALPESKQGLAKGHEAASGLKSSVSFASYHQDTSSWRTSQTCLVALAKNQGDGLAEYSETWPSAGMMRSGKTYQREPWALPITANEFGLLPTVAKSCGGAARSKTRRETGSQEHMQTTLFHRGLLPTLGKNEPKGAARKRFRGSPHFRGAKMSEGFRTTLNCPNYLSPSFADIAMGFPMGWTELEPAETP